MTQTTPTGTPAPFAKADIQICTFLKSLKFEPQVIYDLGASNGAWTRAMLPVFPQAHFELFEPQAHRNSDYDQYLLPLVDRHANLRLHTNLVSNVDASLQLRIVGRSGVGSSLLGTSANDHSIEVPSRTLDSMIQAREIAPPDIIKMDIQGAELLALQGAAKRALPHASILALELWMIRGYGSQTPLLTEVMEFLTAHDYFPFDFGDCYRDEGLLVAQDVWFCRLGTKLADQLWKGKLTRQATPFEAQV
ncbi:MAG TPA: FkbM family methyltransferase [Pirellulaceae bacterium]|nr:FkbM family methyltransferase [Pirellulaceae bacterium]